MRQVAFQGPGDDTPEPPAIQYPLDPWRIVRRGLVGRYRLAGWLGLFTASIGAMVGWAYSAPVYKSEGLVRIASSLPPIIDETEQNRPIAMFDAYLQSQQLVMSSRAMMEMALQDKAWKDLKRQASVDDIQLMSDNLKVEFKPRTDYLRVSFTDSNPAVAAGAVRALVNVYEKFYAAQQDEQRRQRVKALEARRDAILSRMEQLDDEVSERVTQSNGGDETAQLGTIRAMKVESELAEVRRAISNRRIKQETKAEGTPEQRAVSDPVLRSYLEAQAKRNEEVARLEVVYGEQHPNLVRAKAAVQRGKERINEYMRLSQTVPEALEAEEAKLVAELASLKSEMTTAGGDRYRTDRLRSDAENARRELNDVARRLAAIDTEQAVGGRLTVISRGDMPFSPMLNRHLRDAAGGMLAGFLLPGALLVIGSLVRPRYRSCIQAASELAERAPMFAAVLKLEESTAPSDGATATARCIHQMRVRLTTVARQRKTSVYLMTSAGSGEGKTSLTLSLGASFAAAGFKTLVMDADLAGRGVTLGLGAHGLPGLREAAELGTLRDHVHGARDGMCVLPSGKEDLLNAYALPQAAVERLVEEARSMFDIVMIDTGAVFDCIEASMLAPWADGVIFVVARGQREALVEQSLQHLASLDAKLAGVVFNGAQRSDFDRAMRTAAPKNFFKRTKVERPAATGPTVITGFGPVIDSVLSSLPLKQVGEFELLYQNSAAIPVEAQSQAERDDSDDHPFPQAA